MEIWKDIPEYEGYYQVSDLGRVKRLTTQIKHKSGGKSIKKGRIMVQAKDTSGYHIVCLCKNGSQKTKKVHQLVSIVFLNHVPCGLEIVVDHINNIRTDNRLKNLQLITHRENTSKDSKGYSSNFIGVCWNKRYNKWRATISIYKRQKHLGFFKTEQEAAKVYRNALNEFNKTGDIDMSKYQPKYSSKFKGVSWDKARGKWVGVVYLNGRAKYVGRFKTEIEAHKQCELRRNKNKLI